MSCYLYGIVASPEPIDFGPIGFALHPGHRAQVRAVPHAGLAAIVGPPVAEDFRQIPRERLVHHLLAHQATLETITAKGCFLLPFKFGTTLATEEDVGRLLAEHAPLLRSLIGKMKTCLEIDLLATWDVNATLRIIAREDPEILACTQATATGNADPAAVGRLLAHALQRRAERFRGEVGAFLAGYAEAAAEHDLLNDTMVLNISFLVQRELERKFYRAVETIDAQLNGQLHFKCVGPLPPYSFATLTVQRFDPAEINIAAHLFRLNGKAQITEIKRVYRELSRAYHPDRNQGNGSAAFDALHRAYRLLVAYCADGPRSLERAAIASTVKVVIAGSKEGTSHAA